MPPADAPRPQPLRASRRARTRASLRRGSRLPLFCAVLVLLVPATRAIAAAEAPVVYRWVDDQGVAHYTADLDRVPSSVRGRVNEVRSPSADAPDVRSERFAVENAAPASAAEAPGAVPAAAATAPTSAPAPVAQPATATAPASVPAPVVASAPAPSAPSEAASAPAAPAEPVPATGETPTAPPLTAAVPQGPRDATVFEESAVSSTDATLAAVPPPAPVPDVSTAPAPAAGEQVASVTGTDAATLDARIAAIEQEIARDEASLQTLLSEPTPEGGAQLADRPEFREIAIRLPKLQADLRALQDQRTPTAP
jgi:hypothetical protein